METKHLVKILIADDEPANRLLVKSYLSHLSVETIEANDGNQAMEKIRTHHPDLVLLDIKMPYLSGLEILENVKDIKSENRIQTIILTALSDINYLQKAFELGAIDYVQKPFKRIELVVRVENQINQIITQKKLLESEKLKTAVALGGSVAHEMNQPLCALSMLVTLYKEKYGDNDIIEKIIKQTNKLSSLIKKFSNVRQLVTVPYVGDSEILDINKSAVAKPAPKRTEKIVKNEVLIIDDEREFADLISYFLTIKNIKNHTTYDTGKAIDILRENRHIGLVILNLMLNDEQDYTKTQSILNAGDDIYFVVFSDYELSDKQREFLSDVGVFLQKPFDMNELYNIIKDKIK